MPHQSATNPNKLQHGLSLVELMIGIAIGLLVVAVAMVALMTSRGITGTVTDATSMQQQAAYAFRVIGQQIRQAGSIELNLYPEIAGPSTSESYKAMIPVAFDAPNPSSEQPPFDRKSNTLSGTSSPISFTIGYQNYTEDVVSGSTTATSSLLRDCLGQNPALSTNGSLKETPILTSTFEYNTEKQELQCTGAGNSGKQTIIGNVTDMHVRYVAQTPGTVNLQYIPADPAPSNWNHIYAVEVCLELTGTEHISTDGATYKNCSGTNQSYDDSLKMVFRNLYQIRSQGQI